MCSFLKTYREFKWCIVASVACRIKLWMKLNRKYIIIMLILAKLSEISKLTSFHIASFCGSLLLMIYKEFCASFLCCKKCN